MRYSRPLQITTILLSAFIAGGLLYNTSKALTIRPKTDFNIATATNTQADNYYLPNSIVVAPIFTPGDLVIQNNEWYEGIYYYMAERLGQGDFLAHYIVSKDGQVLQGNTKGDEQRFIVNDSALTKPIVIMYLADKGQSDFSLNAKDQLGQLIIDIANRNAIKLSNVQVRSLSYHLVSEQPITLNLDIQGGMWEVSLKQIISSITPQYKPISKTYKLDVTAITAPKEQVNYGDSVNISISLKNNSDFVLYQGTDYEPILEKNGKDNSKFFLNKTWVSQTQSPIMNEDSMIKPGETKTFEVPVFVPLYFGEQSEDFHLENMLGATYASDTIKLSLNVKHPDKTVVEITSTETGQLNVRDGPWASSSVTSRVTPGQRFIVLERTESGYTKLDLGNGKTGWVVSKYTKTV